MTRRAARLLMDPGLANRPQVGKALHAAEMDSESPQMLRKVLHNRSLLGPVFGTIGGRYMLLEHVERRKRWASVITLQ